MFSISATETQKLAVEMSNLRAMIQRQAENRWWTDWAHGPGVNSIPSGSLRDTKSLAISIIVESSLKRLHSNVTSFSHRLLKLIKQCENRGVLLGKLVIKPSLSDWLIGWTNSFPIRGNYQLISSFERELNKCEIEPMRDDGDPFNYQRQRKFSSNALMNDGNLRKRYWPGWP